MTRPVVLNTPTILQQDFTFLRNLSNVRKNTEVRRPQSDPAQKKLILLVAVRIFAVIAAFCFIVRGIRAKAVIGTVVGLLACHEAFVLAHNVTRALCAHSRLLDATFGMLNGCNTLEAFQSLQDTISDFSEGTVENMRRLFEGENVGEFGVGEHILAKGTIISPLWSWLATQYDKRQLESYFYQMSMEQH